MVGDDLAGHFDLAAAADVFTASEGLCLGIEDGWLLIPSLGTLATLGFEFELDDSLGCVFVVFGDWACTIFELGVGLLRSDLVSQLVLGVFNQAFQLFDIIDIENQLGGVNAVFVELGVRFRQVRVTGNAHAGCVLGKSTSHRESFQFQ